MPQLIENLQGQRAVQISAGNDHSLALMDTGQVWSFGADRDDDVHPPFLLPQLVKFADDGLCKEQVVAVAAGMSINVFLTQTGQVVLHGGSVRMSQ